MIDVRLIGLLVLIAAAVLIGLAAWTWLRGLSDSAVALPATLRSGESASPSSPSIEEQATDDPREEEKEATPLETTTPSGPLAPELVSDVWLNSAPLTAADLRGKVVLIEFWTFG